MEGELWHKNRASAFTHPSLAFFLSFYLPKKISYSTEGEKNSMHQSIAEAIPTPDALKK